MSDFTLNPGVFGENQPGERPRGSGSKKNNPPLLRWPHGHESCRWRREAGWPLCTPGRGRGRPPLAWRLPCSSPGCTPSLRIRRKGSLRRTETTGYEKWTKPKSSGKVLRSFALGRRGSNKHHLTFRNSGVYCYSPLYHKVAVTPELSE